MKATLVLMAGLSLAGCSSAPSVYDGDQAEDDRLPEFVVSGSNPNDYDLDSARLLGTAKSRDFYAVRGTDSGHCIATVQAEPRDWNIACAPTGEIGFGGAGVEGRFFPGGYPEDTLEDGWISVHPSLRIHE